MNMYLEHANLTVRNLDRTVRFLQAALPEVRIRGRGMGLQGPWLHIGTDESYLALQEASQDQGGARSSYADLGVNHLGFVVGDADGVRKRLSDAGYREGFEAPDHPFRQRVYFYDDDDNEFEFVQYRSADPAERNDYSR